MTVLVKIAFDGTNYRGFQIQNDAVTVFGTFQRALLKILGHPTRIKGCSRTDSGVHAKCFYLSFDTQKPLDLRRLPLALNGNLPPDIRALEAVQVPDGFHARYDAKGKEYTYYILNSHIDSPFFSGYYYKVAAALDVENMQQAAKSFVGKWDFSAFMSKNSSVTDFVRTVYYADVKKDGEHPRKRLGEQLIDAGFLTPEQLEEGLAYAKEKKLPIGSALVELKYITLDQMKTVLSEQQGLEFFELDKYKIERSVFSLLPERYIKSKKVIPIKKEKNFIVIGMVNANDKAVLSQIKFMTGLTPRPLLIPHIEFNNILRAFEMKKQTTQMVQHIIKEDIVEEEESLWEQVDKELKDNSSNVAKFATKIITDAIDIKASDIHIEPRLNGYIVRYRIAGILKLMFEIPQQIESAIISRFKVVSRMDIAEHRRAQDGTFSLKHAGVGYDFRINTLPVGSKEKMVIRILAPSVTLADSQDKDIKLVGGTAEDIAKIKKMITVPNGIILTAGPTGSGKTTTLYSVLKNINDVSINISTVEDPIEIRLEGVNQTQVNPKADITFASCMRALLRQDPDVILVGEIRDLETLETAISASLTGHLVLSTVHTNSAAATITRLMDMGAKDYLIASTLSGVIAQRLVRRLCDNCKKEYTPDLDRLKELLPQGEDAEAILKTHKFYRAIGCPQCDGGYSGRLGIYEIMQINKEIRRLIAQNAPDVEIEEVAVACGMKTLRQSCFNHIFNGMTTLEECLRVLGIAND